MQNEPLHHLCQALMLRLQHLVLRDERAVDIGDNQRALENAQSCGRSPELLTLGRARIMMMFRHRARASGGRPAR